MAKIPHLLGAVKPQPPARGVPAPPGSSHPKGSPEYLPAPFGHGAALFEGKNAKIGVLKLRGIKLEGVERSVGDLG